MMKLSYDKPPIRIAMRERESKVFINDTRVGSPVDRLHITMRICPDSLLVIVSWNNSGRVGRN